jgi:hypothetical protein
VPACAFIKKAIHEGRDLILSTCMGHIVTKPVYDTEVPLVYMDDILTRTKRGVREVTTEEWGKLKGCPAAWGTTEKDRRWIIHKASLYLWSVLGGALAPTLGK